VQITPDRLPKTDKTKPRQEMSGGVVAVAANVVPQPQPQITATKAAKVTPQISAAMLATPPSGSLSIEQMRMAGALAGARQKAKLARNKRL